MAGMEWLLAARYIFLNALSTPVAVGSLVCTLASLEDIPCSSEEKAAELSFWMYRRCKVGHSNLLRI